MNRASLAEHVTKETGLSSREARIVVQAVLDGVIDAVRRGEKVTLSNFGTFSIRPRGTTVARNPHTGEAIIIPERKAFHFRASVQIQRALRNGKPITSRKLPKGALQ